MDRGLSVAKRHGLIEASDTVGQSTNGQGLSVAKRHGLIEAQAFVAGIMRWLRLSVAKRHGLIEADVARSRAPALVRYPWQNATASLKLSAGDPDGAAVAVIRGKTPRPH